MLSIKKLNFTIEGKELFNDFELEIPEGECHVIMGPNGIGKSSLTKIIMRHPKYRDITGDIYFEDQCLNDMETSDIANLGIFTSMQNPTEIQGLSNVDFYRMLMDNTSDKKKNFFEFIKELENLRSGLKLDQNFLNRSVNYKASGGEKKKLEILQMNILQPKLLILDEIDSGLDVDAMKLVCDDINKYIKSHPKTSMLIITHYPRILEYLPVDKVHVFKNGKIVHSGDLSVAFDIEQRGYEYERN